MNIKTISFFIAIAILFFLNNANSQDRWLKVATANFGKVDIYYDSESLNRYNSDYGNRKMVNVWLKYIYYKPVKYKIDNKTFEITEFKELVKFNCTLRLTSKTNDYMFKGIEGDYFTINLFIIPGAFESEKVIVPNTIYEQVFFEICNDF